MAMQFDTRKMKELVALVLAVAVWTGSAAAQCSFLNPKYSTYGDIPLSGATDTAGFDVLGDGRIVAQVGKDVNLYGADGSFVRTLTSWTDDGFGSFVRVDPSETTVWFGYTAAVGASGTVRTIPLAADNGAYADVAGMGGNFDLEFYGGQVYASGLNGLWSGAMNDATGIWLLDTSGSDQHDLVLEVGGNASGFAFDSTGRLLAGVYSSTLANTGVLGYDAAVWQGMIDADVTVLDNYLTAANAALITEAPGLYDVTVDAGDNVFFNYNGVETGLAIIEDGKDYSSYGSNAYDLVATGDSSVTFWNWLTTLDAEGDFFAGGRTYVADFAAGGVVGYVPEPATMALLGLAGLLWRRKR